MKLYPSISDFITEGDSIILNETTEQSIIQYMDDVASFVESKEMEAFSQASMIVLNY